MTSSSSTADREAWLRARKELLEKEKAYTRQGDELAALRRALPRLKVDQDYVFDSPAGPVSLADLFDGRSQLIVQHFMFGPDWEAGCPSCSFWADGYNPLVVHLNQRDTSLVVVSRAPIDKIEAYRQRMGWDFNWVSSLNNDFNFDFNVTASEADNQRGSMNYNYADGPVHMQELPGASFFVRDDDGTIWHTYSTYGRGLEHFNATYALLDLTSNGRSEDGLPFPMAWVRRKDEY